MSNIHRNISIQGLTDVLGRGALQGRTRSGKTIRTDKPRFDDNRKYGEIEKTDPAAIREATTYADFAKTQDVYLHRELVTRVSAYHIALADWFTAPRVLEIDVDDWTGEAGQTIRVKARDNVTVAGVSVVIRDAEENVLEMGEAVQSAPGSAWWDYTTKSRVPMTPFPIVEATARDLPGNRDSFVIS